MPRKFAAVVAGAFVVACAAPGQCAPKESLPCVSTAEAQGMDSAVLSRGLRELSAETRHLHSLLIARNGCLVAEAYWPLYHAYQVAEPCIADHAAAELDQEYTPNRYRDIRHARR